ncbi:MAG: hypothetical protein AABX03_03255 [Nanoarchaeota archaeon]
MQDSKNGGIFMDQVYEVLDSLYVDLEELRKVKKGNLYFINDGMKLRVHLNSSNPPRVLRDSVEEFQGTISDLVKRLIRNDIEFIGVLPLDLEVEKYLLEEAGEFLQFSLARDDSTIYVQKKVA